MVLFTRKVHRKLGGNFTFLILTDRDDLDTQIYKTFAGGGVADNDRDPCRAAGGDHLKELLGRPKSHIFSLIQKFHREVTPDDPFTLRDDLIVITDEAHRTQYGILALNMRNALSNASYIGFTGTPLFKDDEITRRVFGNYGSTCDFQRAVENKATVPLYYDARGDKLGVAIGDINDRIAQKLEELEAGDIDVAQRLEAKLKRDYHIITADKRLDGVARDFVAHYSTGWETGKAMLVCIDKITCVRMYKRIVKYWDERIAELEAELKWSPDDQDEQYRRRQIEWMRETRADDAFKAEAHPFRIAIVCAMWLTGFDVPCLATLYLDKPLTAHTLMQAIARANRILEGKNNGMIVDYCGILKNLRKALATFAGTEDGGRGGEGTETGPTPTYWPTWTRPSPLSAPSSRNEGPPLTTSSPPASPKMQPSIQLFWPPRRRSTKTTRPGSVSK